MRHIICCLAVLVAAAPTAAQDLADPDSVVEKLTPVHVRAVDMMTLFEREPPAQSPGEPREVHPDASIVPEGIRGIIGPLEGAIILVGSQPAIDVVRRGVRLADVPIEKVNGKARFTVRPAFARAEQIREAVLALPHAESAAIKGFDLTIEGNPAWARQALHTAMRMEMYARSGPSAS